MFYIILILLFFSIFLLIKNFKNRYTWFFLIMVIGLITSIFSLTLEVGRVGNYRYPINEFFNFDYRIFLYFINNAKFSIYSISRLQNIGIGIFLFTVPLFAYEFVVKNKYSLLQSKRIIKTIILALLPIFYIWFYDPETKYFLYIALLNGMLENTDVLRTLINNLHIINYLWIFVYLFYPIYLLGKYYVETGILLIKKQVLSLAGCMFFLNSVFYFIFFIGISTKKFFWEYSSCLIEVTSTRSIPFYYFSILPLVILGAIELMLFVLIKYGAIDTFDFFKEFYINKNLKGMNENLRGVFHSFKNTMFTIKILVEQAEACYGTSKSVEAIQRTKTITEACLTNLTRTLNSLKVLTLKPHKMRLVDALEGAINQVKFEENVIFNRFYEDYNIYAYYDFYHLTEAIKNLLNNAIEATQTNESRSKKIDIELLLEREWVVIKITDNGMGISRRNIKKIFEPFFSTKSTHNNWGVGLAYVYRVVKAHLGFISVDSIENEFTTFQILLPKVKGGHNIE